jgi:hypothetical protein
VPQSSVIAGALILAYILFVTRRGELTGYLQDLGIVSGESSPVSNPYTTSSVTVSQSPQQQQSGGGGGAPGAQGAPGAPGAPGATGPAGASVSSTVGSGGGTSTNSQITGYTNPDTGEPVLGGTTGGGVAITPSTPTLPGVPGLPPVELPPIGGGDTGGDGGGDSGGDG